MLPEELPRVEIEVVPDEVQREGLDAYERIGEQVLERRPASMVVVRIVRPKFVRKGSGAERRDQGAHGAAGRAPPRARAIRWRSAY